MTSTTKEILSSGNPVDGFTFVGPFVKGDALLWAEQNNRELEKDWWIVPIQLPEPTTPSQVRRALDHVRSYFPDVTHVIYTREVKWLYMSDDGVMPDFNGKIDIGLLEDAADAVSEFPAVFCV